jgi:predicted  nucleic acid-binding Zn-ribbon protein
MFNSWARQQIDNLAKLIAFKEELDSKECKALEKSAPKRIEEADEAIAALEANIKQLQEALADQQNAKATAEADLLAIKVKRAELESTLDSGSKGDVVGAALQYVIDGNLGDFEQKGE